MNTKKMLLIVVIACLVSAAALAQEKPILTIENGYTAGYQFSTSSFGSGFNTTLAFGLTDTISASFSFTSNITGSYTNYTLLGLSYAVMPKAGVSLFVGSNGSQVAGAGIYYDLFTRTAAGSLQTGLKLKLNYIAPISDVSTGLLGIGLAATIGI